MPNNIEYEIVKQQCKSFEKLGHHALLEIQPLSEGFAPNVTIKYYQEGTYAYKIYKFADPDWHVVIKQLATLYKRLKSHEKNHGKT